MNTAVAKTKGVEVSTELMDDIFADAGAGSSFAAEEMTMPFIRLAQQMSPQVNKNKPEYIKGIGAGDIFNNLTSEYWDGAEGMRVIACASVTKYTEWVPIDDGGGFVGELAPDDPVIKQAVREGNKELLPNGNEMVKADNYYVLYETSDGAWNPAVLDMKITALKVSRRWKSQINLQTVKHPKTGQVVKLPIFANIWRVSSVEETNKNDQSYANYSVQLEGRIKETDLYQQAKALFVSVQDGEVKAAAPEEKASTPDTSGDKSAEAKDDEIPF
jgi:hypothetical protein